MRPDHDYLLQVRKFPCTFNLESVDKLTISRLRYIQHNLVSELHIGNDAEEELIRKKNLLTLVLFRLGDRNKALEVNDEVVGQTKWANIASLGNRCFIMVSIGDELEAKRCLRRLTDMRKSERKYFDGLLTEALAEQAYCYSRFGGTENLQLAISLFTLVVTQRPENFLWKFGLGLVYRRATQTNIYCSSTDRLDVQRFQALAVEHLFDVGENADSSNLRAMAYAQLVKIRQDHSSRRIPHYDNLFRNNSIQQLCNMALHYGKDIPSVLTQCGRSLITVDLNRAVQLLVKSVSIKRNTIAYHYLGICYKMQAELHAQTRGSASSDVTKKEVEGLYRPSEKLIQSQREFTRSISCDCTPEEEITSQNGYTDRLGGFNSSTAPPAVQQAERYEDKYGTHGNKYNQAIRDSWRPQDEVKAYVATSDMTVPLHKNDRFVKNAIWCYKRAIEISNGENLPAILDLGIILKQTGQLRAALTQFNSVTNSQLSLTGHRVTVISAYEQAGLCYLELSKLDGNKDNFQQDGIKKLTKAITLAADLATTLSELKGCAQDIWLALRTLLSELDKVPPSADQQKQKIRLLELVRDHGQIVEVVQKFRDVNENDLADPDVTQSALVSYLELGQSENALAFLNMVGLQKGIKDLDWWKDNQMCLLRSKVFLHAINGRLAEGNENPAYLFQQLFKLCHGSCIGMDVKKEQKTAVRNKTGDVLFVYDDDQETEEGPSSTMKVASLLADLSTVFFGLEVSENLQGTGECGDQCEIQLNEMLKYQVVIIVLGKETRKETKCRHLNLHQVALVAIKGTNHKIVMVASKGTNYEIVMVTSKGTNHKIVMVTSKGTNYEIVMVTSKGTNYEIVMVTSKGTNHNIVLVTSKGTNHNIVLVTSKGTNHNIVLVTSKGTNHNIVMVTSKGTYHNIVMVTIKGINYKIVMVTSKGTNHTIIMVTGKGTNHNIVMVTIKGTNHKIAMVTIKGTNHKIVMLTRKGTNNKIVMVTSKGTNCQGSM